MITDHMQTSILLKATLATPYDNFARQCMLDIFSHDNYHLAFTRKDFYIKKVVRI